MLQQIQDNINKFIEQFQDRWEKEASFRATWSTIGVSAVLLFICGTMFIVSNTAVSLLGIATTSSSTTNTSDPSGLAGSNFNKLPIPTFTPGLQQMPVPPATPVPTSNQPTPTPTVPPSATPVETPSGTPTGTPGQTISINAHQQPDPWLTSKPNNQITNISTNPAQPNQLVTITLDFGNGCIKQLLPFQLDGNGTLNHTPNFQLPGCYQGSGTQQITATFSINGATGTAQFNVKNG